MRPAEPLDARQGLALDRAELGEILGRDLGDAHAAGGCRGSRRCRAGPRRNALTSSLVTRPFSPVPLTLARSTSSSRASRRTLGLAWTRPASAAAAAAGGCGRRGGGRLWGGRRLLLGITEGGGVTGASPAAAFSVITGVPSPTRSPILTSTASTVPSRSAGTSIVALSLSSVISGSSALIASPGLTWISITGTSLKSPMSGTLTSIAIGVPPLPGRERRDQFVP